MQKLHLLIATTGSTRDQVLGIIETPKRPDSAHHWYSEEVNLPCHRSEQKYDQHESLVSKHKCLHE